MTNALILRDSDGLVTNAVVHDPELPFDPGEGFTLVAVPDEPPGVWIGWTRDPATGEWSPPAA